MIQTNSGSKMKKLLNQYAMFLILAIIWAVFHAITGGTFLSMRNISNLFRQMAVVGVLSIGMAMCLIAGYFDLSVASIAGFVGAMAAFFVVRLNLNSYAAILICVFLGALIGLWNGAWVAFGHVPAFIVTLGSQLLFRGCLLLILKGQSIAVRDPVFEAVGQGYIPRMAGVIICFGGVALSILFDLRSRKKQRMMGIGQNTPLDALVKYVGIVGLIGIFLVVMNLYQGIPIPVFILLVFVILFSLFTSKTRYGRYIYAVGGNANASRLSGINNATVTLLVFALMGLLAAAAGILTTMRLLAATPSAATGMELDAIAACVIGGVSLSGGSGKIVNSILGALMMASLTNGMSLLNINSDAQFIVRGLILIMAVWFDVNLRKRK